MILTHISKGVQDLQIHSKEGNKHAGPSCVHGLRLHNVLHIHTCINGCIYMYILFCLEYDLDQRLRN